MHKLRKLQKGQGMSEYLIIVAVIAIAAIGVFGFFGDAVNDQMSGMAKEISGQDAGADQANAQAAANAATAVSANHNSLDSYDTQSDQEGAGAGD